MGRYGNYPTTVEDCLTFRLKTLTENNNSYLSSYGLRKGVTTWSVNGKERAKISILVNHAEQGTYIVFDYLCNGEPVNYKIHLVSRVSNLGKGKIWYFVCPQTFKCCRKLYLYNKHFLHRTACKGLMYSKQLESKKNRALLKVFDACHVSDEVYRELYKPYFKTHYKGKPTKRYLKLKCKIDIANTFPSGTLERLLLLGS